MKMAVYLGVPTEARLVFDAPHGLLSCCLMLIIIYFQQINVCPLIQNTVEITAFWAKQQTKTCPAPHSCFLTILTSEYFYFAP